MQTQWRGPPRGNGMRGDQRTRWLIDPISGFRVMSSCKLHENVVQGHLVTLGLGVKNQTEQQDCMSLALTGVYGQCQHGNTTNTVKEEGFSDLTHHVRVALKESEQNSSLRNRCTMESLGHGKAVERAH